MEYTQKTECLCVSLKAAFDGGTLENLRSCAKSESLNAESGFVVTTHITTSRY